MTEVMVVATHTVVVGLQCSEGGEDPGKLSVGTMSKAYVMTRDMTVYTY